MVRNFLLMIFAAAFAFADAAMASGLNSHLLLSSAWCSSRYNKVSGYSTTTRVQFYRDGTFVTGSRGEGYSIGSNGSFASQRDNGSRGRWQVKGGELFMSAGGPLEHVPTTVTRNNTGYPIIVGSGIEYRQCN